MKITIVSLAMWISLSGIAQMKDMDGGYYDYQVGDVIAIPEFRFSFDATHLINNDSVNSKDSALVVHRFLEQHHNLVVEFRCHTDCRGNNAYNRDLSQHRAETVVDAMIHWHTTDKDQVEAKGLGESEPFMSCEEISSLSTPKEQEVEHAKNRRCDLKVISNSRFDTAKALNPKPYSSDSIEVGDYIEIPSILFQFDKAELLVHEKVNSKDSLKQLAEWLIFHPEFVIEIRNHSDARWSDKYSYRLQQARADAIKEYLITLGIPEYRMVSKGYDDHLQIVPEEKIEAMTSDEEKEAAHSLNRRTEILVIADDAKSF